MERESLGQKQGCAYFNPSLTYASCLLQLLSSNASAWSLRTFAMFTDLADHIVAWFGAALLYGKFSILHALIPWQKLANQSTRPKGSMTERSFVAGRYYGTEARMSNACLTGDYHQWLYTRLGGHQQNAFGS